MIWFGLSPDWSAQATPLMLFQTRSFENHFWTQRTVWSLTRIRVLVKTS